MLVRRPTIAKVKGLKMILTKKQIGIVMAGIVLATLGLIKLASIEGDVIPFPKLIHEYPFVTTNEKIDSEVVDIYCPPKTRCPGLIIAVRFANGDKRAIQAHYDVSDTITFQKVLKVGSRILKHAGSDTLHLYGTNSASSYYFIIDRSI